MDLRKQLLLGTCYYYCCNKTVMSSWLDLKTLQYTSLFKVHVMLQLVQDSIPYFTLFLMFSFTIFFFALKFSHDWNLKNICTTPLR